MSVAKVALPSSVLVLLAPSRPKSFNCAFQTATLDCPWIDDPLGNALKVVSPGVAVGPAFVLDTEGFRIPQRFIEGDRAESEFARLRASLQNAAKEARTIQVEFLGPVGPHL
jgi:hypothetical protein